MNGQSTGRGRRGRNVAFVLVAALMVALLPLAGAAMQPEPVEDPHDACPDDVNPPAPFVDRSSINDVHRRNVDCAFNNNISEGYDDQTYRPGVIVRRDQFASFMVRTLRAADVDLPAPEDQGFTDVQGNPHEDNINIIAQTGITEGTSATTYSPRLRLRRDQIGSMVLRGAAYIEDVPLERIQRETGPFTDVPEGNPHRRNINGARDLNLTIGRTETIYAPSQGTRRDQMASFLIRLLATLRDGPVVHPEDRAESLEFDQATATNAIDTEHTITVTVTDGSGNPIEDANVHFEVYRDGQATDEGVFQGPQAADDVPTDAAGEATFVYDGPQNPAEDRIVACVVFSGENCEVTDEDAAAPGTQVGAEPQVGARVNGVAAKTWIDPATQPLEIPVAEFVVDEGDLDAVNRPGTDHTVTVTAHDADRQPVEDVAVRFEVYRDTDGDETYTGPVETGDGQSGTDGRASFTYTGPNKTAQDWIVVCAPASDGTCQVTDTNATTAGIQITGEPEIGAKPHATARKRWAYARSLAAHAFGLNVDLLGETRVDRVPYVEIDLPEPQQAEETDELIGVVRDPLADAGLLRVAARGDLAGRGELDEKTFTDVMAYAQGEAEATDVALVFADGEAVITADAIRAVSTSTCDDSGGTAHANETQFVNLRVGDTDVPINPDANTTIPLPNGKVVVNEVVNDDADGQTVRGLRVSLDDGTEIIVAEAHSTIDCVQ